MFNGVVFSVCLLKCFVVVVVVVVVAIVIMVFVVVVIVIVAAVHHTRSPAKGVWQTSDEKTSEKVTK